MSAFIVEDKTINSVVSFLRSARDIDWIRRLLKSNGYDVETENGVRKLAEAMFKLNVEAVNSRYEDAASKFGHQEFKYQVVCAGSAIAAYKSLGCWLYQCCEGEIPLESHLYKLMDQVKLYIAEAIVTALPEYAKAAWN